MYVPQKRFKRSLRDAQDRVSSSFKNFDSKKLSDGGDFLDNVGDHIGDSGDLLGDSGDLLGNGSHHNVISMLFEGSETLTEWKSKGITATKTTAMSATSTTMPNV